MISTFTHNDASDPSVKYLMLTDDEREAAEIPLGRLRTLCEITNASPSDTFSFNEDSEILCFAQRELLCSFLDFVWNDITSGSADPPHDRVDLRAVLTEGDFCRLLKTLDDVVSPDQKSALLLVNLKNLFHQVTWNFTR
jgi:hypothetical protein